MTASKDHPEFGWGDIIQVPAKAFCRDGLNPVTYGNIYGVVVSSKRLWYGRRRYEGNEDQRRQEQEEELAQANRDANATTPNRDNQSNAEKKQPEKVIGGQYLVALIDNKKIDSELEAKFKKKGPFRGWYIAAGLFVSVLDSQMESIPASDRYRGRLRGSDRQRLKDYLEKLTDADWHGKKNRPPLWQLIRNWIVTFWGWLTDPEAESS